MYVGSGVNIASVIDSELKQKNGSIKVKSTFMVSTLP